MRTTIRLDDHLLRQAKEYALRRKKTLTALIEDSLRSTLASKVQISKQRWVKLPTSGNGGVLPGVDLDNTVSLLDIMDDRK